MQKQTEQNTDTTLPPARSAPDPELVAQYGREVKEELKTYPAEGREPTKRIWQLSEWEGIGYYLDNPPPEPKLLFRGKGWEIPDKCVTSLFAAGATGKTFLGFQLAACLAAGVNLGPFETSQIMRPAKKKRVLYLCGEDPQDIIHARIAAIVKHMPGLADRKADLRQNLGIHALVGFDRILIAYDQKGNPTTTEAYDALCYSIEKIGGVDVLALDPMNKFYGLKENDNAHAAAWIAMLETISIRFDAGVLFVHHESKAQNLDGDIRASSGRGAGAFRDSVRGVLSMARMTEKQAKPTAMLMDESGKVGQLYGAKTTPHMYIINPQGQLVYAGAIDSIASSRADDIKTATNFVRQGLTESLAGKPVSVAVSRAYGCSVKYKT